MRRAPVVTTASRTLQERAVELRQSSKGVFYIPNCGGSRESIVHQERALSMSADEAKKSFVLGDEPVIFYSGHFEAGDELMFFCRAASPAARRFGATIVVVGEGLGLPRMKEFFTHQEGVAVRFFPRLPYDQFVRLLAA